MQLCWSLFRWARSLFISSGFSVRAPIDRFFVAVNSVICPLVSLHLARFKPVTNDSLFCDVTRKKWVNIWWQTPRQALSCFAKTWHLLDQRSLIEWVLTTLRRTEPMQNKHEDKRRTCLATCSRYSWRAFTWRQQYVTHLLSNQRQMQVGVENPLMRYPPPSWVKCHADYNRLRNAAVDVCRVLCIFFYFHKALNTTELILRLLRFSSPWLDDFLWVLFFKPV